MGTKQIKLNEGRMRCDIDMEKSGQNIKRLVRENDLSVRKLSELMGNISEQAIYKWYRGDAIPSIDNLYALKGLLGLDSIDELLVMKE